MHERVREDKGPLRGHGDGLRADGERALSHPEGWVQFLRTVCAGCHAAAGRVHEHDMIR